MRRETNIPGLRRVLSIWTRRGIGRQIDEEIQFHLRARAEELIGLGASERDAWQRARDEYGDIDTSRGELLRVDRRRMGNTEREELFMSFIDDVRYAWRGLTRRPALLLITTGALCIGIAANAVMFGIVNQLLLKAPAGIVQPEDVKRVYLRETNDGKTGAQPVTAYPLITALQNNVPALSQVAGYYRDEYSMGRGADARMVDVEAVTGNYFPLLGAVPPIGRSFAPGEDTIPQGARVAIVSHRFWETQLGSQRDVLGASLHINGSDYTVIGVAPRDFSGVNRRNVDLWIPISAIGTEGFGKDWYSTPGSWWVQAIGRVAPNASIAQAEAQATTVFRAQLREWNQKWRDSSGSIVLSSVVGARAPDGLSDDARVSLWLIGVSFIVLLIACANVANLLIARALDRRREIAVRLALGVSRGRLLRMLFTEAGVLATMATVAALLVAYWGSQLVQQVLLTDIVWTGSVLDARVLAFTMALTILCIVVAGIAPAVQSAGLRVADNLKAGARSVAGSRGRLRQGLLVTQAALSVVLLIGAGLFVSSLRKIAQRDVGVDLDRVLMVTMDLTRAGFDEPRIRQIFDEARERLGAVPGVEHAAVVKGSVPMRVGNSMGFKIPGVELPDLPGGGPYGAGVPPEFFPTVGARLVRGRMFTEAEARTPTRVMLVNEMLARAYWPTGDPIGTCVQRDADSAGVCTEIIGVVENIMLFSLVRDDRAMVYLPSSHPTVADRRPSALLVRAGADPAALVPLVRREIQAIASNMPFIRVRLYADLVAPQLRPWRLGATMFTLFGGIALIIATVGLYSIMAYWVSQRTHEIGVRMALGAQRGDIVRLVGVQAARAMALGLVIGGAAAAFASRWLGDILYETSPRDPMIYAAAAVALGLAALLASVVPARRSTGVDPALALRSE